MEHCPYLSSHLSPPALQRYIEESEQAVRDLRAGIEDWAREASRFRGSEETCQRFTRLAGDLFHLLRVHVEIEAENSVVALVRSGMGCSRRARVLLRRHLFHFIRVSRETVWAVELRRERIPEWWHPFNERELREQLVAHYMADEVLDLEETWKRDPKEWGRAVGRLICDRGISIDDLAHGTLMSPRQIYAIKAGKVSATHPQNRDAINDFLQG